MIIIFCSYCITRNCIKSISTRSTSRQTNVCDKIFAKYNDHTLPKPFSKSDNQYVETFATVNSSILPINRIQSSSIFLSDSFGNPITDYLSNVQMQIVGTIENKFNYDQEFIYFFQIKNSDAVIVSLSWIQGQLSPNQILDISQSWIPEKSDTYFLETYVWNSLNELTPMSPSTFTTISVDWLSLNLISVY